MDCANSFRFFRFQFNFKNIDLNLEVTGGEIFGFIGPNVAGKSTTIQTLLAFIRPTVVMLYHLFFPFTTTIRNRFA